MMNTKKTLASVLVLVLALLLLTACGSVGDAPSNANVEQPAGSHQNANDNASTENLRNLFPTQQPETMPDPAEGEDLGFVQTETFTDVFNTADGYSIRYTMTLWNGKRGTGNKVLHPGNNQIAFRTENKHVYIPYEIFVEHVSDHDFTMDSLRIHEFTQRSNLWRMPFFMKNIASEFPVEAYVFRDLTPDYSERIFGYARINDFYSPQHPNGDFDGLLDTFNNSPWRLENEYLSPIWRPKFDIEGNNNTRQTIHFWFKQSEEGVDIYHYGTYNWQD